MTRSTLTSFAILISLLFALQACKQNIEDIRRGPDESSTKSTTSTQTVVYDPHKDPLVNQPDMFQPAPQNKAEIASNETLIWQLDGSPTNLNPIFQSAVVDQMAVDPIYQIPFTGDAKMNWVVNKDMVESYEESPDHLVWTVKLKPGLTWHDGQPFTAEDFRFSWQAINDDKVPSPAYKTATDQIADVQAIDARTIRFVTKEALAVTRWNISYPIIPKHIYDNPVERKAHPDLISGPYYNKYNREGVVGFGPYKLAQWIPNDRLVYERWEDYKGTKPYFKRIIMKIQPDPQTTLLLFKQGQLDYIERLTSQQFARETNDSDFAANGRKAYGPQWIYSYIGWNMDGSNPFFSDIRVRRAMTCALDIQRIIRELGYNLPQQAHGIFHPDSWMYDPTIKLLPFDRQLSAKLLDKAGWKMNPDDGWRYKTVNGKPVKFEFEILIPQGAATSEKVAAIFANDLKAEPIGVSLKTRVIEWTVFQQMTHNHEFQACMAAWGSGTDPEGEWNIWHSSQYNGGRNYGGYKNARADQLLDAGRREFDPAKRAKIYQELSHIIYDDQPYTFMTNAPLLSAVHKRLRGMQLSPVGLAMFYPGWNVWWVPANQALRQ
ncbi:ABC transporter substrate-binding protein [bacterium]|nr:ABC transporter substrate-binding protein [bacterium]